ncbi:hypothetical protein RPD_2563 [Rhodopseudomonas palustris BisB5]|uniref:Uncharacterized protein n=1 Tax=Rhodopseudomonas palustris (strain BisB5) TaxID=316057 RepID=Q137E6_RHOPS|nr:hypothetical protein RPD_2563 [Rhodopseudomonas palustris BisB5]
MRRVPATPRADLSNSQGKSVSRRRSVRALHPPLHSEGWGRAAWREGGEFSRWLRTIAQRLVGAPTAAVLGVGTVLPGAGSTGISPASGAPVQPRKRQPLVVAADGDLLPPGRVIARHNARDAASSRHRQPSWRRRVITPAGDPAFVICPAIRRLAKRPSRTGRRGL